jgi:hypothetical protein
MRPSRSAPGTRPPFAAVDPVSASGASALPTFARIGDCYRRRAVLLAQPVDGPLRVALGPADPPLRPTGREFGWGPSFANRTAAPLQTAHASLAAVVGPMSAYWGSSPLAVTPVGDRLRRTPAAQPPLDDWQLLGLKGQSRWRVHDHLRKENVDRDDLPVSVGRGENHPPIGKGGCFRDGSMTVLGGGSL